MKRSKADSMTFRNKSFDKGQYRNTKSPGKNNLEAEPF